MRRSRADTGIQRLGAALFGAVLSLGVAASSEDSAEEVVKKTTERVLEAIKKEREVIDEDPGRIFGIVDQFIIPHFDFERMSQRVLGKYWHRATDDQRARFAAQFQTLLVRTYAAALREYSAQKVEYLPSRRREGGEVSVRTQIVESGRPPIPIQYEMHDPGNGWKVYDVSIDGVSLVINYRSTFASEIRNNGLDGLIERLAKHNQQKR